MSIEQDIINWDGKSSSDIEEVYKPYCDDNSFFKTLVKLCRKSELQKGATWLLKRHFENGKEMESNEVSALLRLVPQLEHWESKLHVLQCLPYLTIGKSEQRVIEVFLRACITDANKFVRAWAYNGLCELARQFPAYKPEVEQLLELAMKDEAASVRARIRKIIKAGFFA